MNFPDFSINKVIRYMFSRKNPQTDVNSVTINAFNVSAECVWNPPTEHVGR